MGGAKRDVTGTRPPPGPRSASVYDGAAIEALFVEAFLAAHPTPPAEIVLDLDATDDPLHGSKQEGRFLHGYYRAYCYPAKANPRFVVTSLPATRWAAAALYEELYCACGDVENRIKEQQLGLFADRTSTATMRADQLRLWFSSVAYVLVETGRRAGLVGTAFAQAQVGTIRTRLLKVGALVTVSVRRVVVALSSIFSLQRLSPSATFRADVGESPTRVSAAPRRKSPAKM